VDVSLVPTYVNTPANIATKTSQENKSDVESDDREEKSDSLKPSSVYYKNRVDRRINEALDQNDVLEQRRSADLVPLTHAYQKYRKELRKLIAATKDYVAAHENVNSMRGACLMASHSAL
jgi:hypothetical protein